MSTLSYIQFLWKSQNDHGIHSPFMFRFVTKCFYAKGPRLSKRSWREQKMQTGYGQAELLYRIVNYLKPARSFAMGNDAEGVMEMLRYAAEENRIKLWFFSSMAPIPGGIDMACIADKKKVGIIASFERIVQDTNNDTLCIVGNIHDTPETEAAWQMIMDHPKATVTVDIYHVGLVFFRREQVKQHFMVRPSKSFLTDSLLGLKNLYGLLG